MLQIDGFVPEPYDCKRVHRSGAEVETVKRWGEGFRPYVMVEILKRVRELIDGN